MNKKTISLLKLGRKIYKGLFLVTKTLNHQFEVLKGQEASNLIEDKILSEKPFMVSKFGAVELACIANYISIKNHPHNYINYLRGRSEPFWWDNGIRKKMAGEVGFFPATSDMLEEFSELMMDDMHMVDILGTWQEREDLFYRELYYANRVELNDLEPYNHKHPWSAALKGRTVLVIDHYSEAIYEQYLKRELLFENKNILPEFNLKILSVVHSAGNKTSFTNWFDALNDIKNKISSLDFEIAIIGGSSYGFSLAAHVKRIGKKAIHLGDATQTLFGIRKNWQTNKADSKEIKMANEHWIMPLSQEIWSGMSA